MSVRLGGGWYRCTTTVRHAPAIEAYRTADEAERAYLRRRLGELAGS